MTLYEISKPLFDGEIMPHIRDFLTHHKSTTKLDGRTIRLEKKYILHYELINKNNPGFVTIMTSQNCPSDLVDKIESVRGIKKA